MMTRITTNTMLSIALLLTMHACNSSDSIESIGSPAPTGEDSTTVVQISDESTVPNTSSANENTNSDINSSPIDRTLFAGTCETGCNTGYACKQGSCLLSCEENQTVCGHADGSAECCAAGSLCHLSKCTVPGVACDDLNPCASNAYCDTLIGQCLPQAPVLPGQENCEYSPTQTSDLNIVEERRWESSSKIRPDSYHVMMAPVVANLNDDNADGHIDENDIPDIIFSTFPTTHDGVTQGESIYSHSGTLRAISGANMEAIWWTDKDAGFDPGYFVNPGASLAVADIDPTSPGPEIVACEADLHSGDTTSDDAYHALIISHTGELIRRIDGVSCGGNIGPVIGDMDNDGIAEIGVKRSVFHADGSVLFELPGPSDYYPSMVDINDNGKLEYVTAYGVFDATGTRVDTGNAFKASSSVSGNGYAAVADIIREPSGTTPRPEIVVVHTGKNGPNCADSSGHGEVNIIDTQNWTIVRSFSVNPPPIADDNTTALEALTPEGICDSGISIYRNLTHNHYDTREDFVAGLTPLCAKYVIAADARDAAWGQAQYENVNGGRCFGGGPPTIGNFDADPEPEIAFAGAFSYSVYNSDGSELWSTYTADRSSRVTGSSLFDFDGDGKAEVLYNDERRFRVFESATGKIIHEARNPSGTLYEYPIVVDVDNDGASEIVFVRNDYWHKMPDGEVGHGVLVMGNNATSADQQWVRTRRIWNQHTYHVTNINEDGTIPRGDARTVHWKYDAGNGRDPWHLNTFRKNIEPNGLFNLPDLVAEGGIANADSNGGVNLRIDVINRGTAAARRGTVVSFYDVSDESNPPVFMGDTPLVHDLFPGSSLPVVLTDSNVDTSQRRRFVAHINDPVNAGSAFNNRFQECRLDNNRSRIFEILSSGDSTKTGFSENTTGFSGSSFR